MLRRSDKGIQSRNDRHVIESLDMHVLDDLRDTSPEENRASDIKRSRLTGPMLPLERHQIPLS